MDAHFTTFQSAWRAALEWAVKEIQTQAELSAGKITSDAFWYAAKLINPCCFTKADAIRDWNRVTLKP